MTSTHGAPTCPPRLPALDPPPAVPGSLRRIIDFAVPVAGVLLFAYLVWQIGGSVLLADLRQAGWGITLVVGQEILAIVANTLGWWQALPPARSGLRFRDLLAARIAGDAFNYVTPTASVGGEFVRVRLLRGRGSTVDLAASVAFAKVAQTVAQVTFIVGGLALLVTRVPFPVATRLALIAGTAVLAALTVALVVVQRRGMFDRLGRLAAVFNRRWADDPSGRLRRLDAAVTRLHGDAGRVLLRSSAWFLVGWALGALEVYVILWLLAIPATVTRVLTIEALSVAIDATLFFVPGKIGTQEASKVLIFVSLGLDPAKGLAFGVLRRIRELTWTLAGLLILSRRSIGGRPLAAARDQ